MQHLSSQESLVVIFTIKSCSLSHTCISQNLFEISAIPDFFFYFLAYANQQGELGLNEHTLDERPLPSNSTLSFSVAPTVPRLINSTTTKGPIKTNSSAVLNQSGSSISQSG